MPTTFSEYLILILIALLFAKDYLLPSILKKLGLNGKNEDGYQGQINELKNHAKVANKEMGEIREDIRVIKNDIDWIKKHIK